MAHGDYEKLTPEAIDELWVRLRSGKAAKPAARELGLGTSTVPGVSVALRWDPA
jgi:hypothetical protein